MPNSIPKTAALKTSAVTKVSVDALAALLIDVGEGDEDFRGVSLWLHRKRAEWRAEDARSSARGEIEHHAISSCVLNVREFAARFGVR